MKHIGEPKSFICPRCGRTSHNPTDAQEGYCAACHDWTAHEEPKSPEEIEAYLRTVPPEIWHIFICALFRRETWHIFELVCHALQQRDDQVFETELRAIEAAVRQEGLQQALGRGAEPFWQDIRLAQKRIQALREATREHSRF